MALRDQPYLPLYVQDFLSDEKLMRCSAESTGVYIRLMCVMHKSEHYGVFAIREKDKISDNILDDFARVFSLFSPYSQDVIRRSFQELLDEEVIYIYRDWLCQKRMIKDAELSDSRAKAGKQGMQNRYNQSNEFCYNKALNKTPNKNATNSENETENEGEAENEGEGEVSKELTIQEKRFDEFWKLYPKKQGKGAARRCWVRIKPDTELFETIIKAVMDAKMSEQWQKERGQFIPNPATWLNQSRWEDELPQKGGFSYAAERGNSQQQSTGFKPSGGFKNG